MALQLERDSVIVQFVFALEKASVAAVKRDISMVLLEEEEDLGVSTGSLILVAAEGISLGSYVDVMGAGSSSPSRLGIGGGVGISLGSSVEVMGAGSSVGWEESSRAARKFWRPLRLGIRKL